MMNVQSKMEGNKLILYVLGEIDHHTAKEIRKEMDKQIISLRPKEIRINLSSVSFMDSSGLGLIMGRYAVASDIGAALKVVNPTDSVARIMLMAGLDKIVPIERIK
ncbi:MAG: STAS domain-containing protein [Clostridiales bacterium]|nr:STAS domain-containing protein [Clostridiales bacterium]